MKLLAFMSLLGLAAAIEYDCHSMIPLDGNVTQSYTTPPFGIVVGQPDSHDTSVQAGTQVTVTIRRQDEVSQFTTFILMAHYIGQGPQGPPVGTWSTTDGNVRVSECEVPNDHVIYRNYDPKIHVTANWTAPNVAITRAVEFIATVANSSRVFWNGIHSTSVDLIASPEAAPSEVPVIVEPVPVEDPDFHDERSEAQLAADMAQQQQEMIDDEIQYSEGDWQRQEEADRRSHQEMIRWEQQQFEIQQQEEEEARQARIRAEILDQEEHDAAVHLPEEETIDWDEDEDMDGIIDIAEDFCGELTCGASSVALSLGLLSAVLAALFM